MADPIAFACSKNADCGIHSEIAGSGLKRAVDGFRVPRFFPKQSSHKHSHRHPHDYYTMNAVVKIRNAAR